jgi:hypothetical protein
MRKSTLQYVFTWVSIGLLLAGTTFLVAISWNSRVTATFSPSLVVLLWFLTSASGIYLFLLAVKKAHRQWITEKLDLEKEKALADSAAPAADPSTHTMDFSSISRKLVRRTPEKAALEEIGKGLLKNLARELEIMSGIFYVEKKGSFEAVSTYALVASTKPYEFKYGEGLSGQAARNQQLMVLSSLPEGHLEVYSGLGKALPSYLAIVPLIHKGKTVAVIECSGYRYKPQEIENMFRIFSRDLMHKLSPNLS